MVLRRDDKNKKKKNKKKLWRCSLFHLTYRFLIIVIFSKIH